MGKEGGPGGTARGYTRPTPSWPHTLGEEKQERACQSGFICAASPRMPSPTTAELSNLCYRVLARGLNPALRRRGGVLPL